MPFELYLFNIAFSCVASALLYPFGVRLKVIEPSVTVVLAELLYSDNNSLYADE